jgi:hypothetical protein
MKVELSITDAQTISDYEENGVCVVRNVLDPEWIARMGEATDRILANPGPGSMEYTPDGKTGRYYGDFFIWRRDPDFNEFMAIMEIFSSGAGTRISMNSCVLPRCPGWQRNSCRRKNSVFSMTSCW